MSLKKIYKHKLEPRYYGPYKVLHNIGSMAYKLELPSSSRAHPIFHVSCLNKVVGDRIPIQTMFLELDEEGKVILELRKESWKQGLSNYIIGPLLRHCDLEN